MNALRLGLLVLVVGAFVVVAYGLYVDNSGFRLPLIVSGLAVLGIAAGLLGFSLAGEAFRQGRTGHGLKALAMAFIGGLFVMGAAGSLAGAIVLGILTGTA